MEDYPIGVGGGLSRWCDDYPTGVVEHYPVGVMTVLLVLLRTILL